MQYIGEWLTPGYLGYLFVSLSFGAALIAFIAYFLDTRSGDGRWKKTARGAFLFHAIGVFGIIITLFYLIYHHRFEYHYVWAHSSNSLPVYYMISCFWEGQEGSFLLWTFWHVILGFILLYSAKIWESPVMAIVMLAQVTLSSMLLGVQLNDLLFIPAESLAEGSKFLSKLGSNPFILLRDAMPETPIFSRADYLSFIEDGKGLNPLLQNYWMVIHPPVLFLGFAATIVPFAYAIAGLWKKAYSEWVAPAIPWTLFGVMILGTGILMGGAWAYEALNFGGFWAWDPVENASLVPWLLLVAGLHTLVIQKNKGTALVSSLIFLILGFLGVLYATFLTRSGILGESSVHSFTDLGLSGQLLIFIFIFLGVSVFLMVREWNRIPKVGEEEKLYSREFWMFIGALVFSLSAFHVTFVTSFPVFNKIPGVNLAQPIKLIEHYNKFQLPFAILIALISGFAQYLKYRKTNSRTFWKKSLIALAIALIFSLLVGYISGLTNFLFIFLMVSAIFSIVANFDVMIPVLKNRKYYFSGSSISHIGFALILLGALISTAQQEVISLNRQGVDFGEAFDDKNKRENIYLQKNIPTEMGDYLVTYIGDSVSPPNTYYKVRYIKLKDVDGEWKPDETFVLMPYAQINENMGGLIASPDTRHYFQKDIYTHVTSVPVKTSEEFQISYGTPETYQMKLGDTVRSGGIQIIANDIDVDPPAEDVPVEGYQLASSLALDVTHSGDSYMAEPLFIIKGNQVFTPDFEIRDIGMKFRFVKIHPAENKFEVMVFKGKPPAPDYIIMKAIVFPYINFLWIGSLTMVFGVILSIIRRVKEIRRKQ